MSIRIKQEDYKKEFKEIKDYFDLDFLGTMNNKNAIVTKWGTFVFWFDNNSIFGRFEDLKIDSLPPKIQKFNNDTSYELIYYPNLNTGKMNFHFFQIFDFINTIDRIFIYKKGR